MNIKRTVRTALLTALCGALLSAGMSAFAPLTASAMTYRLGDVNGSGAIDSKDYALTKRTVLRTYSLDPFQSARADVNRNGRVDAVDYQQIKRTVLRTHTITGTVELSETAFSAGLEYELGCAGDAYTVTGIGTCTDVELVIPDQHEGLPVTSIGEEAFYGNDRITGVTIPDAVKTIELDAFTGCSALTSVTLPEHLEVLSAGAFARCEQLKRIRLPETVRIVSMEAFAECSSLEEAILSDGVMIIEDLAFAECSKLHSLQLPDSLIRIGNQAFEECGFRGDEANWDGGILYAGHAVIGSDAGSLAGVADIREGTVLIASGAFQSCEGLTGVNLPDSLTAICGQAFGNCIGLTSVRIPEGVEYVGPNAFWYCTSLAEVSILGAGVFTDMMAFYNTAFYNDEANWENGVLYAGPCLLKAKPDLTGLYQVREGTCSVAGGAFSQCGQLTGVSFPETLRYIGERAFGYCKQLEEIRIPEGVERIERMTFQGCTALDAAFLPSTLNYIGEAAFDSAPVETVIPSGVTFIGDKAFRLGGKEPLRVSFQSPEGWWATECIDYLECAAFSVDMTNSDEIDKYLGCHLYGKDYAFRKR
ncbi:MAG: leucine-rich repeat protein [Clostridia bacterium]|nr:leucine-rich repeat protein [Clostridia bacterium]